MFRAVLAASFLLVAGTACDVVLPPACTLIGCENTVRVEFAARVPIDVAIDVAASVGGQGWGGSIPAGTGPDCRGLNDIAVCQDHAEILLPEGDYSGEQHVTFEVRSGSDVLVHVDARTPFQRSAPNGERCGPICWQAVVRET